MLRRAWIEWVTRVQPSLLRPRFSYESTSANDRWIAEYLFPGKRGGYFVEAGAATGGFASSCYILETHLGWTGICIEPNDGFFAELVRSRPNSIHENVCLAGAPGTVPYIEGVGDADQPYLSGILEHLQHKAGGAAVIASGRLVQKQALSLAQILDKHRAPATIDYGSFDIEGSELEVLQAFPFSRYAFRALSIECDGSISEPLSRLLAHEGYREVMNPFNRAQPWERYWLHRDTR
jgi:hypothetical protein